jgi:hypothetical protein
MIHVGNISYRRLAVFRTRSLIMRDHIPEFVNSNIDAQRLGLLDKISGRAALVEGRGGSISQ